MSSADGGRACPATEPRMTRLGEAQAQRDAPKGSGKVTEPSTEKELIQILGDRGGELDGSSAGMPIVVHFCHKEFRRCDIMDSHLEVGTASTRAAQERLPSDHNTGAL